MVGAVQTEISENLQVGTNTQFDTYDRQGNKMVSEGHGRYWGMAYGGNLFTTSVPAAAALTIPTTLATLASKFCLLNPSGSGVNLELLYLDYMTFTTPVINAVGLTKSNQTTAGLGTLTAGVINNLLVNAGRTSQANFYVAATHTDTPVWFMSLFGINVSTALTIPPMHYDFGGSVIIPPGNCIDLVNSTATQSSALPQLVWAEWPV